MLGRSMQTVFVRVYVMMILNLFFWVYTLAGLIVFGVAPAFRTVVEMYLANKWDERAYHFTVGWRFFREHFWASNRHAFIAYAVLAVLVWNLYLSTQLTGWWVIFIQFILVATIVFTYCTGIFTVLLRAQYEIAIRLAVRLAIAEFFSNFTSVLAFLGITGAVGLATARWPGLGLFLSIGAYVVLAVWSSRGWYSRIEQMIDGPRNGH